MKQKILSALITTLIFFGLGNSVYSQNPVPIKELSKERALELEKISRDLLLVMKNNDYEGSKKFFAENILLVLTKEQMSATIALLDFNKELEFFSSGNKIAINGKAYDFVQFKYKGDNSLPPKELLKIMFDDQNKIVSFQPVKLQGRQNLK